jgi:DUF1680 family protein
MNQISREARYMDVVEKALYNTVLAGIALDGKSFFYVNPLEVWPPACMPATSMSHVKNVRQKWFGVACCPPNIARTLASLGQYIYSADLKDPALYVNLFVSGESSVPFEAGSARVSLQTRFPYEGRILIRLTDIPAGGMDLYVRIPEYARNFSLTIAEKAACQAGKDDGKGYRKIHLDTDTELEASFDMPARYVFANGNVRADIGKTAIMRGPLVYCLEECDNGPRLPEITADIQAPLTVEDSDLFGGCKVVRGSGTRLVRSSDEADADSPLYSETPPEKQPVCFTAVPYPYWNNRGVGEMLVWLGVS